MNELIRRLSGVKRTGHNQYLAKCPAHRDSNPSLSVKILEDGRTLIHCHAGCGGADVMRSVGMRLSDLYPEGSTDHFRPNWYMRQERAENDRERMILDLAHTTRSSGKRLSAADKERERQAFLSLRNRGAL